MTNLKLLNRHPAGAEGYPPAGGYGNGMGMASASQSGRMPPPSGGNGMMNSGYNPSHPHKSEWSGNFVGAPVYDKPPLEYPPVPGAVGVSMRGSYNGGPGMGLNNGGPFNPMAAS